MVEKGKVFEACMGPRGKPDEGNLAVIFGWKTLACTAEERVDPNGSVAEFNHNAGRRIRHVQR